MWQLQSSSSFKKSFKKLHPSIRQTITEFLEQHRNGIEEPFGMQSGKLLEGYQRVGRWRFGGYRLGFFLDTQRKIITLRYVGPRGDFYKHFPRS